MSSKDLFSGIAHSYARFRPYYPDGLFQYISQHCASHQVAWDCGTGNGQAAVKLADYFNQVVATDISDRQLQHAQPHSSVLYRNGSAENSGLPDHSVDCICAAQAAHWFHFEQFFQEVNRVAAPGAVIALIGYGLIRVNPEMNTLIDELYYNRIGTYWDLERKHIDQSYYSIPFPFHGIDCPAFNIRCNWNLMQLTGYLSTWSACMHYREKHGSDILTELLPDFQRFWSNPKQIREIQFPVFCRMGRV